MAIAAAAFVLVTAVAPHAHDGVMGRHACPACVSSDGGVATPETPDVAPVAVVAEDLAPRPFPVTDPGFPLGAVRGQSPPAL